MSRPRIYLDNAATSWPKPNAVYQAVEHYMRELGAPAGRSGYHEASVVERQIAAARKSVAHLLNAESPSRIAFCANGTDALNMAIHGLLRDGDHVVTTVVEHNSVLRPLRALADAGTISVTHVACDSKGRVDPADVATAIQRDTRLVALIHASNVTGAIQPVEDVAAICREREIPLLLDAAQSVGHCSVDVKKLGVSLLACSGHKGMLGPLGTGILYLAPGMEELARPYRQGGTGTRSEEDRQPRELPHAYESGNHNVLGILGLEAGVSFVRGRTIKAIRKHETALVAQLIEGLREIDRVTIHGPGDAESRVGVVSISISGFDAHEVASTLDSAFGIQVRSGLHCAPRLHRALGTLGRGGAIRFSLGIFNTSEQINTAVNAVRQLAETSS